MKNSDSNPVKEETGEVDTAHNSTSKEKKGDIFSTEEIKFRFKKFV